MPEFLAERYEPGATAEALSADVVRLTEAVAAMREEGAAIEFLGASFLPVDEGMFAHFASASEQLVADAHTRAAIPYARIVETRQLQGGTQ